MSIASVVSVVSGLIGSALVCNAIAEESPALIVHAAGFAHGRGQAVVKLFEAGDAIIGPARLQVPAPIENGQSIITFADLAPGRYAIVVFHDENGNGQVDHNALRFPTEALGFSNGFALGLLSGVPTFEKLAFQHGAGTQILEIDVK